MASMTVPSTTNLSDYASRSVTVEVIGDWRQIRRTATYRMTVPYSRLSQTIQQIHRRGGKINQVILSSAEESSNREFVQLQPQQIEDQVQASLKLEKTESEPCSNSELPELSGVAPASVLTSEPVSISSKPRRFKSPASSQSSAKSTKPTKSTKSTTKSTKNAQGQRSKRKSK